jgi:hypothetical protein
MRETRTLPIDYLRKRLRYEPDTGKLFWLDYEGMPQKWRTRYVGKEALASLSRKGYKKGKIGGVDCYAHRVAYALHHTEWPSDQIDHVNGVKTDNRIINLRVVTNQENNRNVPMRRNNSSGVTGVCWDKRVSKWRANVVVGGKFKHLGYFDTVEEAAAVRKAASEKYGFTERHGLPTNVGEACD